MSRIGELRFRAVTAFQRRVANPLQRRRAGQTLLETTGRVSGEPRQTPVGGKRVGDQFWLVSEFGEKSQYVRNIQADPNVKVRLNRRWHRGVAQLLPDDDPVARLGQLPRTNSAAVRAMGNNLLTIRIDLSD